ncbi:MAG TPA: antibiotic biosynthesis monooxygenase [Roseiflexaceae bacterium]|jgi:heme-degrading monooxygenase HmoA|nr:antibiotic biosynthesis monooxygenase [Roseiflexaceae bacterium]
MIARTWHGAVPTEKADAYHQYLLRTGVPDYRKTPGNQGVYVLRRTDGDVTHFLLMTLWESLEAIKAFAGDAVEQARYYPEDQAFLLELEPTVTHYDVLVSPDQVASPA